MHVFQAGDLRLGPANARTSVAPVILRNVEVGWVRYDADLEGYTFACGDGALARIYQSYQMRDMPDTAAVLAVAATALNENRDFFSGWFNRARLERFRRNAQTLKATDQKEATPMTDVVTIARTFRPDPLGRDEADVMERLHAMANDALAKKDEAAVEQEAEVARALLGFRR